MKKKIKIMVADPAGNITIFVKDSFDREQYPAVAGQLLADKELKGEQVAFILDTPAGGGADGKMEMCGLEFCGNGSRSFGLITAKKMGIKGKGSVNVDVSGCDEILTVEVDTEKNYTKIKMPNPLSVSKIDLSQLPIGDTDSAIRQQLKRAAVLDFGGILHVVLKGVTADRKNFDIIKDYMMEKYNPPALGVMFCGKDAGEKELCPLVPVVYVKDVDTTYFEGSCGSGTTACAAAFGLEKGEGTYRFVFPQPAGTIESTVVIAGGKVDRVFIEGLVGISPEMEKEIEL